MDWLTGVAMPLISSIVGGAIALIGVRITMNNEEKVREKEERKKVKPVFIPTLDEIYTSDEISNLSPRPRTVRLEQGYSPENDTCGITMKNISGSPCHLTRVVLYDEVFEPIGYANTWIDGNSEFILVLEGNVSCFYKSNDIKLFVEDIYGFSSCFRIVTDGRCFVSVSEY